MKTTAKTHYRWIGEHGAYYYTSGHAVITTPGYTADGATVEVFATNKQFPTPADFSPVDPALPLLTVSFIDPAGKREHDALANAGYRIKDDATYYQPWPEGAADAARAYWQARR